MLLAMSPILLGEGEIYLLESISRNWASPPSRIVAGENATHILIKRT